MNRQDHILDLCQVLGSSREQAVSWYRLKTMPGWNKTPEQMVAEGRAEEVVKYLNALIAGDDMGFA